MKYKRIQQGFTRTIFAKQNLRGFTLLEIVVSLGILAMLGLVLTQSFVSSIRTNSKGDITQEVVQNGNFAVERISRMILNAAEISSSCTIEGVTSSDFSFTNRDGGVTTLSCVTDSGVSRLASSSGQAVSYLTSDALTLGSTCDGALEFTCELIGDTTKKIYMTFSLSQKNATAGVFETSSSPFELTVTTRN